MKKYIVFPVCPKSKKLLINYLMVMPDKESAEKTKDFMRSTGMATVCLPANDANSYEEWVSHYKENLAQDMVETIKKH